MASTPTALQIEVEQFLTHEASLLEDDRFDDWLEQFTDDVRYMMPTRERIDPSSPIDDAVTAFALYDDDKNSLILRVRRLQTGQAYAEVPPSITQRLITNVMVADGEAPETLAVRSNFLVFQQRRGTHSHTFIGSRRDTLRRIDGTLKIAAREIHLAQTILPGAISIFF